MTVEVHNPDQTESKPLNTELETLAPEATAEQPTCPPKPNPRISSSDDAGTTLDSLSASSDDADAGSAGASQLRAGL